MHILRKLDIRSIWKRRISNNYRLIINLYRLYIKEGEATLEKWITKKQALISKQDISQ